MTCAQCSEHSPQYRWDSSQTLLMILSKQVCLPRQALRALLCVVVFFFHVSISWDFPHCFIKIFLSPLLGIFLSCLVARCGITTIWFNWYPGDGHSFLGSTEVRHGNLSLAVINATVSNLVYKSSPIHVIVSLEQILRDRIGKWRNTCVYDFI